MGRRTVFLTIDLEDYRRQELRDHRCGSEPAHPYEVERQLEELLEILDSINTRATFLVVGRLAKELGPGPGARWRTATRSDATDTSTSVYEPLGPKASLVTCKTRRLRLKIRRDVRFLPIGLPTSTLTIAIHGLARYWLGWASCLTAPEGCVANRAASSEPSHWRAVVGRSGKSQ